MTVKKTLSTFRLTLLLYAGILLLPIVFLFSLNTLNQLESDTKVIRELGRTGGDILAYSLATDPATREKLKRQILTNFKDMEPWFSQKRTNDYYVGATTPYGDFKALKQCWETANGSAEPTKALACWSRAKSLTFAVERMIAIKTDHIRNLIILDIALAVGLLLLVVFVIRYIIHHQICKDIVHAPAEGLHGRDYCRESMENLCSQAGKFDNKLSTLHIIFPSLGEQSQLSVEKQAMLTEALDEIIRTSTRVNDIPCRIGKDEYLIIQPFTGEEESAMASQRMQRLILGKLKEKFPTLDPRFKPTSLREGEECEAFIERSFARDF